MSKTIAIHGLGLMGASLGLALRKQGIRVHGYARRRETLDAALERGVIDVAFDEPAAAVIGAEIVVLCTPVLTIPELATEILPSLETNAIITDVGSTKAWLHEQIDSERFVGSHPMCGSEKTGLEAACPNLYVDAVTVVTGSEGTNTERITAFWESVGSRVLRTSPHEHDALVARTSHLPHLVAAALVGAANREEKSHLAALFGSGYRDTTRVAAGSPNLWHDIVKTNAPAVLAELEAMRSELKELQSAIRNEDFEAVRTYLSQQAGVRNDQDV